VKLDTFQPPDAQRRKRVVVLQAAEFPLGGGRRTLQQSVHDACMTAGCDWTVAGADFKRKATKWRCPTGDCQPKSVWVKADKRHPVVVSKGYDYGFVLQRFRKGSY
jgi:hypothetical protein